MSTLTALPPITAPAPGWPLAELSRADAEQLYAALGQVLGKQPAEGPADRPARFGPVADRAALPGAVQAVEVQADALEARVRPVGPVVGILGPLRVVGAAGAAPVARSTGVVSQAQTQRCAAFAAFLALHPGASAQAVHAAFWPGARAEGPAASASRNKLATGTRRYLGHAADGAPFFPAVSAGGYRLHEAVTTDWHLFCELVGDDPVSASTPALVAALRLVRGAAFEHARPGNVAWTDELHRQIVETVGAAAHELAVRSLEAGRTGHARMAARVGRIVDPANEAGWRDGMLAEAAAGARGEVGRMVAGLYAYLDTVEASPEAETMEVLTRLREAGHRMPWEV